MLLIVILYQRDCLSNQGTTQGDPYAMGMYGIGIIPLLYINLQDNTTRRIAFADDFNGICTIEQLKNGAI